MKSIIIFFLLVPISLWACSSDKGQIEPSSDNTHVESMLPSHLKNTYQMVWNDEFDGTTVNLSKWNFRGEGTVRNYGIVSRQTISLDGKGNVSIKVTKDADGKYYIGELGTDGIYETTYVYF